MNYTLNQLIDLKLKDSPLPDSPSVKKVFREVLFDMSCAEIMKEVSIIHQKKSKLGAESRGFCLWLAGEFANRAEAKYEASEV